MADPTPADPVVEPPRMSRIPRISLAWLVPLVALAVSLGVAWRTYSDRGPIIEILFENAAGIVPGETTVRHRDLAIGMVESVGFTSDLDQVVVRARVQREMARYIDEDATFWLVRARVGPAGITGLETVLTGAYIEASFDGTEGPTARRFTALPRPPLTPAGQPGTRVTLHSPTGGSLATGAPVLFKQIAVGTIESVDLTEEGEVSVSAFIDAPHDALLNSATRFWNASGFTVEIGPRGAALRVDSLASLVQGGIAFDTIAIGGGPAPVEQVFQLYDTENDARNSVLTGADWATPVRIATVFDGSVRGLRLGADVEYNGVRVGEVTGIQARIAETLEGPRVLLHVTLDVLPNRFGVPESDDAEEQVLDIIEAGVARGLRAQLTGQGLLGTTLYVNLVDIPGAAPGTFDRDALPVPMIPSAPVESTDLMGSATGLLQRVAALPLEDVVRNAATLLDSANAVVSDESVRAAPAELGRLIADIRELVQGDAVQEAPAEVAALIASARAIVDQIAEQQLAAGLAEALQAATRTMESVGVAADGVPAVLDEVAGTIRELPLDAAVEELRRMLADLREGGAVENANATLAAIRAVADELAAARLAQGLDATLREVRGAVGNVATASDGLPELLASLTALAQDARDLPLEDMVAAATRLVENADALITGEGVAALPASAGAALDELRGLLADLRREGGAIENASATLLTIRGVADQIAAARLADSLARTLAGVEAAVGNVGTATEGLPELLESLTALSDEARALPLDELVASARRALASADALIASEAVAEVPASLNAALAELRTILAELRDGGTVDNASATLAAVRTVAEEIAAAGLAAELRETLAAVQGTLGDADTAIEGLPALLESLTALSEQARELPLDELVASAQRALAAADALIASEAVGDVPGAVNAALAELRQILAELRTGGAVENAAAALVAVRSVTEEMAAARLAAGLRETLAAVRGTLGEADTAIEGLPALIQSLTAVSEQARELPLDELVASATSAVAAADALIASEAVGEVPQSVNLALAEIRLMLADLRSGGAVENVNATLASVRVLADDLASAQIVASLQSTLAAAQSAASSVDTATAGLPELVDNLKAVSQQARELPLDQLVASGRQVLDTADRLLASEGMAEVPPRLAGALAELRLVLADLREGGAVENLNATLASADEAAAAVAAAVQSLPALVAQLSQTATRAEVALNSVAPGSEINRDTVMLLRELREAARSVNSLVTALERRPSSVLFGR